MSTATLVHSPTTPRTTPNRPALRLSRLGWTRLRRSLTIGALVAATAAGIMIGVSAPDVSPVAPALAGPPVAAEVLPPAEIPSVPTSPVNPDTRDGRRDGDPAGQRGHR
jgi:hypothetical protein